MILLKKVMKLKPLCILAIPVIKVEKNIVELVNLVKEEKELLLIVISKISQNI
jgi:hypothetical protein